MGFALTPYNDSFLPALRALNERLRAGKMEDGYLFDERRLSEREAGPQMPREQWLLMEGDAARGGALLQPHEFWVSSEMMRVVNVQTPVSEGRVDHRYAPAAAIMMKQMERQHTRLFALGMGNLEEAWPRLLMALKWRVAPMPFFFRVHRARAFLENIGPLRTASGWKKAGAAIAAQSGLGALGLGAVRLWKRSHASALRAVPVNSWDTWVDRVWESAIPAYSLIGRRKAEDLPHFLPIGVRDLTAWRFEDAHGDTVGWAAAMVHRVPESPYFGDMIVGTLLDAVCVPGCEERVAASATHQMERLGADLTLSNQTHRAWREALRKCGYFSGPSNYMLGTSPKLTEAVDFETVHVTRADGDGRIHL